ncbi:cytochrome c oxidase subunit 8A, mitochondrial-like [Acipenser ruthenus]|uniref:cytochrome c oxidase subunit 8A, mitochondrial n=1 Tax=Acipenser ruthenus TaxID=7906 RepID=UPI0015616743|nr:cytochrome c oxidase subunit 8A, mitochondrial [Acipenser ruthenus]XP_034774526.1 cytochrome c oxidase subunit 8A, mitochondrial-like [Acipenser ruthenus]
MSALLRGILSARSAQLMRGHGIVQRANLYAKPAKENIGTAETAIGFMVFTVALLGPAGWVLANLENYKKRD